MPVGYLIEESAVDKAALQSRLGQEWRKPDPQAGEPIIVIQSNPRKEDGVYLYVFWKEWAGLDYSERAEIIMRSYAATHSKGEILRVTCAYGYTPNEAMSRRIFYKVEDAACSLTPPRFHSSVCEF